MLSTNKSTQLTGTSIITGSTVATFSATIDTVSKSMNTSVYIANSQMYMDNLEEVTADQISFMNEAKKLREEIIGEEQ